MGGTMSSVIISGDTSGSVTLQAPAVSGNTTVTLPVTSMNIGNGGSGVSTNTAVGASALNANTTGSSNTAVGDQSLVRNTSGAGNTAFGRASLPFNTTGALNTATGREALYSNTTGEQNTAVGHSTLQANTTANNNTAVGFQASYSQQTGGATTAVGMQAAYTANGGYGINAFGYRALYLTTTGVANNAFGSEALANNTTGSLNTAMGHAALKLNTTGSNNTAFGEEALQSNTTAANNTAVGYQALNSNTTGIQFVAVGTQAGYSNTSAGSNGCYVGYKAGYAATGSCNTFVGAANQDGNGCGQAVTTGTRNTILGGYTGNQGGLDIRTANNYIVLSDGDGNPRLYTNNTNTVIASSLSGQRYSGYQINTGSTYNSQIYWDNQAASTGALFVQNTSGGVYLTATGTSWISNSDERLKENLVPITDALTKVNSLRAVIGNFISDESKNPTPFLIAQDVQAVLPEAVTSSTIKGDETNTEYLGVAYTEIIPLLVASIKELNAKVIELEAKLESK
jgi:hypothetical protein